jgi:hypothetical protein
MAILQALLALITKSAGKILNAIFGWAVRALFGQTSSTEQTFLSAIVAAAVAWPLLLVGIVLPKVAALSLAFVPIPHSVPSWTVRVVWLGLALLVPVAVGIAIATKAPPHVPPEPFLKRLLRGFPITVGLAAAFVIMFVSVPIMRLYAMARRLESADVPLITDSDAYDQVGRLICDVLTRHGFALERQAPGWWVAAPTRILGWFGGDAFRAFVPKQLAHYVANDLEVSLYPSGVLLRGQKDKVTWAHGIIAETVVHSEGYQTRDSKAQALERELRRLWKRYDDDPKAHAGSAILLSRLREVTRELSKLPVPFDDWQTIYRQILQVQRAIRGEPQLLDQEAPGHVAETGETMAIDDHDVRQNATEISTPALLKEIAGRVELLAKKQFELMKAELLAELHQEAGVARGLGIAAVAALAGTVLLMVTGVLALSMLMPAWMAGLVVSGAVLLVAAIVGLLGWRQRVREPLPRSRDALKEDVKWVKERLV